MPNHWAWIYKYVEPIKKWDWTFSVLVKFNQTETIFWIVLKIMERCWWFPLLIYPLLSLPCVCMYSRVYSNSEANIIFFHAIQDFKHSYASHFCTIAVALAQLLIIDAMRCDALRFCCFYKIALYFTNWLVGWLLVLFSFNAFYAREETDFHAAEVASSNFWIKLNQLGGWTMHT